MSLRSETYASKSSFRLSIYRDYKSKLVYFRMMTTMQISRLIRSYKKYRLTPKKKNKVLDFLRSFMPEIIFRSTKLEGEPVTRKQVRSLFR